MLDRLETLYLVSCVSRKSPTPAPAKDLYTSDWFVKARDYVERRGGAWYILSAEYGLVEPDRVLCPYERTLNAMGVSDRRDWAARVEMQMTTSLPDAHRVIVLAGRRYREFIMDYLEQRYSHVEVPMARLAIGKQLRFLKARNGDG